jgi:transposase-like protein/IS1 family transposase
LAAKGQVNCYCCNGLAQKFGRFENRNRLVQRYRCIQCGKSFSESQPLDGGKVDFKDACHIVHLLVEGTGVRAISRLTGRDEKTVLRVLESAGESCARLLDAKVRNLKSSLVSADEVHGFVFCKTENNKLKDPEKGEFFTYLSVDVLSKLIINFRVSKRDFENTMAFMQDLKSRMAGRFQLTTDAFTMYWQGPTGGIVGRTFGNEIDYATEKKIFAGPRVHGVPIYAPLRLKEIRRRRQIGNPEMKLATTCHCERTNLSLRLFNRRFTRKTLGYSKTVANLRHAVAIFTAHFNFCRVHSAIGRTSAQAANLTDHKWTIEELLSASI